MLQLLKEKMPESFNKSECHLWKKLQNKTLDIAVMELLSKLWLGLEEATGHDESPSSAIEELLKAVQEVIYFLDKLMLRCFMIGNYVGYVHGMVLWEAVIM